jgi:hypothetical protein
MCFYDCCIATSLERNSLFPRQMVPTDAEIDPSSIAPAMELT